MKKLILILLLAISFNASAQLVTYEIDTTGYSNGMIIPSPHFITINTGCAERIDGEFHLNAYMITHLDTFNVVPIKNDSVPSFKSYPIATIDYGTLSNPDLSTKYIESDFKSIYGADNVSKLE